MVGWGAQTQGKRALLRLIGLRQLAAGSHLAPVALSSPAVQVSPCCTAADPSPLVLPVSFRSHMMQGRPTRVVAACMDINPESDTSCSTMSCC